MAVRFLLLLDGLQALTQVLHISLHVVYYIMPLFIYSLSVVQNFIQQNNFCYICRHNWTSALLALWVLHLLAPDYGKRLGWHWLVANYAQSQDIMICKSPGAISGRVFDNFHSMHLTSKNILRITGKYRVIIGIFGGNSQKNNWDFGGNNWLMPNCGQLLCGFIITLSLCCHTFISPGLIPIQGLV